MEIYKNQVIEGIFVKEIKNRFLCFVMIDDKEVKCYVPSSSRLENYINLKNKKVLLTINRGRNISTKYSVFAVKYYNKYIILNLHYANKLFEFKLSEGAYEEYSGSRPCKREIKIDGYKADLFYETTEKIIIENKAIISTKRKTTFPIANSQRGIEQLKKLEVLLKKGYKVNYNLISLSPYVKTVKVDANKSEFYEHFLRCIRNGMQVFGYCLYISGQDMHIESKKITVII